MSSILDALRKIEREEGELTRVAFDLDIIEEEPSPPRVRRWAILGAAGTVLLTGTVAGLVWLGGDGPFRALDLIKGMREPRVTPNESARMVPAVPPTVGPAEQQATAAVVVEEPQPAEGSSEAQPVVLARNTDSDDADSESSEARPDPRPAAVARRGDSKATAIAGDSQQPSPGRSDPQRDAQPVVLARNTDSDDPDSESSAARPDPRPAAVARRGDSKATAIAGDSQQPSPGRSDPQRDAQPAVLARNTDSDDPDSESSAAPPDPRSAAVARRHASTGGDPNLTGIAEDSEPLVITDVEPTTQPASVAAVARSGSRQQPKAAPGHGPTGPTVPPAAGARDDLALAETQPPGGGPTQATAVAAAHPTERAKAAAAQAGTRQPVADAPVPPARDQSFSSHVASTESPVQVASARPATAGAADDSGVAPGALPEEPGAPAKAWRRPLASRQPPPKAQARRGADDTDNIDERIETAALTRDLGFPRRGKEAATHRGPAAPDKDMLEEEPAVVEPDAEAPEAAEGLPAAEEQQEEQQEEVLRRPPRGAPRVSVSFLYYSEDRGRRRVMLTLDDNNELHTLYEGQTVESFEVARILPDQVHLRYQGKLFAVRPRYR